MAKKSTFIIFLFFIISCKKENPSYPVPEFNLSKSNYYLGETVHLSVLNSVAGEVFTWQFGDGTTANGSTVTHQYSSVGLHSISLSNQNTGLGQNVFSKAVKVFPGNASFRLTTNIPGEQSVFQYAFISSTIPYGSAPSSELYQIFNFPKPTISTDTIFINIADQKTPMYLNIVGSGDHPNEFSYTVLFDNTKLYQNQNIVFADTTMVYYPQYFSGSKIPFGSY